MNASDQGLGSAPSHKKLKEMLDTIIQFITSAKLMLGILTENIQKGAKITDNIKQMHLQRLAEHKLKLDLYKEIDSLKRNSKTLDVDDNQQQRAKDEVAIEKKLDKKRNKYPRIYDNPFPPPAVSFIKDNFQRYSELDNKRKVLLRSSLVYDRRQPPAEGNCIRHIANKRSACKMAQPYTKETENSYAVIYQRISLAKFTETK